MARFKIKLYVSDRMTRLDERGVVRMPLRSRKFTSSAKVDDNSLRVVSGNHKKTFSIKQIYKEDLGKIDRAARKISCFLTQADYDAIVYKRESHGIWITNELEPIMIGADPEFVLLGDSGVVRAGGHLDHDERFGSDGTPAELRPKPSQDVIEVVNNISDLLISGHEDADQYEIDELDWKAGACYPMDPEEDEENITWCPVGGHIHLGNPDIDGGMDRDILRAVADVLDDLIVVPLIRIDGPHAEKRRQHHQYGVKTNGDRWQFEENDNRLEWRTPSGIWLCHPLVAEAVLGVTKAVAESFYVKWADSDHSPDLITTGEDKVKLVNTKYGSPEYMALRDEMCDHGLRKMFGVKTFSERRDLLWSNNTEAAKPYCKELKKRLKGLEKYENYQPQVDAFTDLVNATEADIETLDMDLKKTWVEKDKMFLE